MLKWFGATMVLVSCGSFGFSLASEHRKKERTIRRILRILTYMECQLQYHLTPLPELCREASRETGGSVREIMEKLAVELEKQTAPDTASCMNAALRSVKNLPRELCGLFKLLGRSLGKFDLLGQLAGLAEVREACNRELDVLNENRTQRLRSYRVLGISAGAALAILLL